MTRSVERLMATDYDAPRKTDEDLGEDSLQELQARRSDKNSGVVDEDETEAAEGFELPGADLSGEELSVRVLPRQADEFTCSSASSCTTAASWPTRRTVSWSARSAPPESAPPAGRRAGGPDATACGRRRVGQRADASDTRPGGCGV